MTRPPKIDCAWCKVVSFTPTRGQLGTISRGGSACCSKKCRAALRSWKYAREQKAA